VLAPIIPHQTAQLPVILHLKMMTIKTGMIMIKMMNIQSEIKMMMMILKIRTKMMMIGMKKMMTIKKMIKMILGCFINAKLSMVHSFAKIENLGYY
jgi:hypothetical protein